jgi:hypothetical protein
MNIMQQPDWDNLRDNTLIIEAHACAWCGENQQTFSYPARIRQYIDISGDKIMTIDKRLLFCSPKCREIYLFYP